MNTHLCATTFQWISTATHRRAPPACHLLERDRQPYLPNARILFSFCRSNPQTIFFSKFRINFALNFGEFLIPNRRHLSVPSSRSPAIAQRPSTRTGHLPVLCLEPELDITFRYYPLFVLMRRNRIESNRPPFCLLFSAQFRN